MGREQLSGFEGKAILAQITQDRAMAPGAVMVRSERQSLPGPRLRPSWRARGSGALSSDQELRVICKGRCLHARGSSVGTPTHSASGSSTLTI